MDTSKPQLSYVHVPGRGQTEVGLMIYECADEDNADYLSAYEIEAMADFAALYEERNNSTNWMSENQLNLLIRVYTKLVKKGAV